ncbi:MAG: methylaspartate mutase subunit S [Chloroflexi bacterium]|nr:methylaspartate mutase subunit S [Chloroflexota bacterium]
MPPKTIVMGVIGADAHIVGNWVLKFSLEQAGFKVVNLGAAVSQKELINAATEVNADAILISSLIGHAMYDCAGFRQACEEAGLKDILLYIGGYLGVGDQDWKAVEKQFQGIGFNRAYPPGTLPRTAIADLNRDLSVSSPTPRPPVKSAPTVLNKLASKPDIGDLTSRKWSDARFFEQRKKVLALWPTGREVDLEEVIRYHKSLPDDKVFSKVLDKASQEGSLPIIVEGGHATVEESLRHKQIVDEAGADGFLLAHDSYTKSCRYADADRGIKESLKSGKSMLNGYPYVNHGVKALRSIVESTRSPLLVSASSHEEPMLSAEMGFAGGGTSNSSQALRQLLAHSKTYPLPRRIQNNQYASRLAAYYTEHGAPIEVRVQSEVHSFVPGGINAALGIFQCLLDAAQGVKYMTFLLPSQYSLLYDIAMIRTCRQLTQEYLEKAGYKDVRLLVTPWPWHGQWPREVYRAAGVVAWHTTIALLGGGDWVHVKSVHEGMGIPTAEANAASVRVAKQVALMSGSRRFPDSPELELEMKMLELEVRSIVDKVIELGDGDVAVGQVKAVESGAIDAPMCPWRNVAGRVLAIKDRDGVFRYIDHGGLPLPEEVVNYHHKKIADREKAEGRSKGIEMLIDDVFARSK